MSGVPKKPYVEAADFVRAATVVPMISVHTTWYMANGGHWVGSGAALALLHYTRESFMALTGFVLTYSLFGKSIAWVPVLWRRYRLVLFPYLLWSAAYMLIFRHFTSPLEFLQHYGRNLLDGGAWFHLYYLLVTMQFYLLLPLYLALMRVAKRHPWVVFSLAATFQLLLMAYDQYGIGHRRGLNAYTGEEVWSYTFYFVAGGLGALFWRETAVWLNQRFRLVLFGALAAAALMIAQFFAQTFLGHHMAKADAVLQPAMVPWAFAVIVLLAAIGVRYEERRRRGTDRCPLIKIFANLSFGMYLVHPMLLQWWTDLLARLHWYHPSVWLDGITMVLLVSASTLAAWAISRTPVSPWIIGRAALPPGVGKEIRRPRVKKRTAD
ncbi:acyltransferase [Sulfobacillus harzensis]|uniref:Acyltransferase n=1 Tax=Sulfobacillus harzensis TaxID=2729629 RepID=A0A7Y0L6F9_9FIRM|nr:acyltransferase [Sulfobacillus harzensis]NMP24085.1 acyltransferase [Sulfobacillus harzensis]